MIHLGRQITLFTLKCTLYDEYKILERVKVYRSDRYALTYTKWHLKF